MIRISKVYKSKKDRLVVYLPFDVVAQLDLKEGDELDFFKRDDYFIVAKKSDIARMLTMKQPPQAQKAAVQGVASTAPNERELALLKKMDTVRYNERTKARIASMLTAEERKVVAGMIKKKFVELFKKSGDVEYKFSIPRDIYQKYLMRKGAQPVSAPVMQAPAMQQKQREAPQPQQKKWEQAIGSDNGYLKLLETQGYLVIPTEAEAAGASLALEESIRRGLVVGTRAFNKKFYIATKVFVSKAFPKIGKLIGLKSISVSDISKETGIDEDGIRAVLYIMAESGDVTEVRRDVFRAA